MLVVTEKNCSSYTMVRIIRAFNFLCLCSMTCLGLFERALKVNSESQLDFQILLERATFILDEQQSDYIHFW